MKYFDFKYTFVSFLCLDSSNGVDFHESSNAGQGEFLS